MVNVHSVDRFVRLALALVLLQVGAFWVGGAWRWAVFALAAVFALTAWFRFCPMYRALGLSTVRSAARGQSRLWGALGALLLLGLAIGGSYGSLFASKKLFLEAFNGMNHFYKQTLFLTGKGEREVAVANYEKMVTSFNAFENKYTANPPYVVRADGQFLPDLLAVKTLMTQVEPLVRQGDLHQAHLELEKVRPIFQGIFKRNGLSMLSVALIDFHDAMELVLDAAQARNVQEIVKLYPAVSEKLATVEAEANDAEIQTIRKNLEAVLTAAQGGQKDELPAKADALKSSFVKVYLKRG